MKKTITLSVLILLVSAFVAHSQITVAQEQSNQSFKNDFLIHKEKKATSYAKDEMWYAYLAEDPSGNLVEGPVKFNPSTPGEIIQIAPTSSDEVITGACWAGDFWWGCQQGGGYYLIDHENGNMTFFGTTAQLNGLAVGGGEFFYGVSDSVLYELNPLMGFEFSVGPLGSTGGQMMGIATDADGNLFGFDVGDDMFYSIDGSSGAATAIGPLGVDFEGPQDMAIDKSTGVCYIVGYTGNTCGLYTVDVTTGAASLLSEFPSGMHISALAIPYDYLPPVGPPPDGFDAEFVEDAGVECTWGMSPPPQTWLGYDDGVNAHGMGASGGGTFHVAIRWGAEDLVPYNGMNITKFQFFPRKFANNSDIKFKIWEDTNASFLIYEQVLENLNWNEWNTISLDMPQTIDASKELWVGFEVTNPDGEDPIGCDDGPAIAGYGDMVSLDGATWESLSVVYNLDFNYNLKILVEEEVAAQPFHAKIKTTENQIPAKEGMNTGRLEFIGVNIYRNGNLVNPDPVQPPETEYTDAFFEPGIWIYTAKAVYDEGLSDPTPGVEVIIPTGPQIAISPDSLSEVHTNPPQITMQELTITNTGDLNLEWELTITPERVVKSNKTPLDPEVYHQLLAERMAAEGKTLPSAEVEQSPVGPRKMKNNADAQWDVEYTFSALAASCQAVATDGEYFYLTYWNGTGEFDKFDMDGNFIESFTISEAPAIRDFAYDGDYFYGAPNGGMTIAQLDLANQTVVSTIPISSSAGVTGARHLAYDPDLDYGSGGFWLGQWSELAAVDMSGNALVSNSETPNPYNCYGSAYDIYSDPGSPKLWLFTQNAGASPNDLVMLEEFDIGTLSFTGFTLDLYTMKDEIPGYIPGTVTDQTIAGGAFIYQDEYLRYILAVNIQQSPNLVVGLELAQAYVPNDVCVYSIVEPASGVSLGNNEPVTITIRNFGFLTQTEIPWEVSYTGPTGAGTFTGIWTGSLAINESVDVTLAETIDMSVFGDYEIEACTMLSNDYFPENDCKLKVLSYLFVEYCDASTSTEDEWIANVHCASIDNSSGWQGGVADYTDISIYIPTGESEAITITNGNAWAADMVTIWVDWNMDYEFGVGTNEEFFTENVGGTGETFVGEIVVPAGTPDGDYRMRIRMSYNEAPYPCGNASYGEVEDYTIHVGEIPAGWLTVDQTSGVILPGESDTIMVSFDSEGLNVGSYNSALLITSNAQNNPLVEVPCSLQVSLPTQSLVFEPFEDYNAGDYLVEQAIAQGKEYWTTWSGQPGSEEDPMVSDEQAFAGSNAMVIQQGNDAVLKLPQNYNQGVFQVNFDILIPSGKTGYFNCLQMFAGTNSEWGMQAFFDVGGAGSVDAGGAGAGAFTYTYDTWHHVEIMIDLDIDNAEMYLNDELIVEWQWSTGSFGTGSLNEFHALNFYAWGDTGTPGAYFDDIEISTDQTPVPDPPTNLQAVFEDNDVILFWDYAGIFEPQWITYSQDEITNSIGTNDVANFDVAARWDASFLEEFENGAVTKIYFVPGEPGDICTYTLKVWSGNDNPALIYDQELSDIVPDVWNEVTLDMPVPFDNTQELWIGFNCNATSGYPAGCDDGPQVEGWSNMMYWEGEWVTLTSLNPDLTYNWAIQGYIDHADGAIALPPINDGAIKIENVGSLSLNPIKIYPPVMLAPDEERSTTFNIYRDGFQIASGIPTTYYTDEDIPFPNFAYFVTAVVDGIESEPSNVVYVYLIGISEEESNVQIFPNPSDEFLTIDTENRIIQLSIFDMNGLKVHAEKPAAKKIQINTSRFEPGIYSLQLETEEGMIVRKVVVR